MIAKNMGMEGDIPPQKKTLNKEKKSPKQQPQTEGRCQVIRITGSLVQK